MHGTTNHSIGRDITELDLLWEAVDELDKQAMKANRAERVACSRVLNISVADRSIAALNIDRRWSGLAELKERKAVPRPLAKLVEVGEIVKSGDNRATDYKLACG
ncbi:hypothetical protein ACVIHI_008290 [Bradyrhizobium sp. USDA 4524]|uniref:hypothetical protein n=1 Tax=unclassified Bradyrhizobium TaxID=2631580 RepID=UPI00209E4F77|nr:MULTISPECIES: hypothetical protein [unclassified Bradyrhizobium]MCP1838787.1 hypothetical protein [Bradyrhizobium sp. USDA 4538]MCP1899353.1 hypothetical protein [Bradyrhizobium sp. USDA 4537]MCP1986535.1 hypothetical protein [Bradyrhizobium sp. USDA 4539]